MLGYLEYSRHLSVSFPFLVRDLRNSSDLLWPGLHLWIYLRYYRFTNQTKTFTYARVLSLIYLWICLPSAGETTCRTTCPRDQIQY